MHWLRLAQFFTVGYTQFGWRGHRAKARQFTPGALDVDLKGRHYIVTGASSGLGRATAEALALRGGTVHLVVRNAERGAIVADSIKGAGGNVHVHECDISSLKSIEKFVNAWGDARVDALVNNAGVMVHRRWDTSDGIETNFATNTLGSFVLTEMLRPALEATPGARVVSVSSGGMYTSPLEVDDLSGDSLTSNGKIDGAAQYARNKRQQVALTEHWARRYASGDVFWASMHPGWADTPGVAASMPEFHSAMKKQMRSVEEGADTIVWLAVATEARSHPSGSFFFDRAPASTHLFAAGTAYPPKRADELADKLRSIAKSKGVQLP